jgi:hypothetical protein
MGGVQMVPLFVVLPDTTLPASGGMYSGRCCDKADMKYAHWTGSENVLHKYQEISNPFPGDTWRQFFNEYNKFYYFLN